MPTGTHPLTVYEGEDMPMPRHLLWNPLFVQEAIRVELLRIWSPESRRGVHRKDGHRDYLPLRNEHSIGEGAGGSRDWT